MEVIYKKKACVSYHYNIENSEIYCHTELDEKHNSTEHTKNHNNSYENVKDYIPLRNWIGHTLCKEAEAIEKTALDWRIPRRERGGGQSRMK